MAEWVPKKETLHLMDADEIHLIWRGTESNAVYVSDLHFLVFAALRGFLGSEGRTLEAPIVFEVGPDSSIRWWSPPPPALFGEK